MKSKTAVITLLALLAIKASAQAPGPPLVLEHANVFLASQSPWLHDMTVVRQHFPHTLLLGGPAAQWDSLRDAPSGPGLQAA